MKFIKISTPILLIFLASCSVKLPGVVVTGSQTSVERQIIGEYKEIEKDSWAVSSLKHNVGHKDNSFSYDTTDKILFYAMKRREYYSEKLREYKAKGAIGERKNGFIKYISVSEVEKDKIVKKDLAQLISAENKARQVIFKRSVELAVEKNSGVDDIQSFGEKFAAEQKNRALKGDWLEETDGRWIQKK